MTDDQSRPVPRASEAIDRGALLELLSDETGWEWDGEQDEPAPIFGCDTRVPSSRQALEAFADRILALVRPVEGDAEPQWSFTPEGHDDEYEYVVTSDCDGQYPRTWRRRPARHALASEWELIPNLPPKEQRRLVGAAPGEEVRS